MRAVLCLIVFAIAASALAQTYPPPKTAVYFYCSCDDQVASQLATAFRDRLATSPRFFQTNDNDDKSAWHVRVTSMDPGANDSTDRHV